MSPEYWFSHAALAAILSKAAEDSGDEYNRLRFAEAAVWFTAQGMVALALSAAEKK